MGRTCLLVIDVQQALVDAHPHEEEAFLGRLERLLAGARSSGVPVVHVRHHDPVGEDLEPGTPGWEFHPVVRAHTGEPVFGKAFNSAFRETGLEPWLRVQEIQTLVVCGMQTEHCLDASIKSASERGFQVVVPEGAHTTFDNGGLTAAQIRGFYQDRIWNRRYAQVRSVEAILTDFALGPVPSDGRPGPG